MQPAETSGDYAEPPALGEGEHETDARATVAREDTSMCSVQ